MGEFLFPPVSSLPELLNDLIAPEHTGRPPGPPVWATGFPGLDRLLDGGQRAGQVTLVTGSPGVGTSRLVTALAQAAAEQGGRIAFIAPDTSEFEINARLIAANARVPISRLRTGRLSEPELERLRTARAALTHLPIWINAGFGVRMDRSTVLDTADYMTDTHQVSLLVLDGIGQSEPNNRALMIDLRVLAQARQLVVLVVVKGPSDSAPELDDLVDLKLRLVRESAETGGASMSERLLSVDKNRYGPCGELTVLLEPRYSQILEVPS